VQPESPVGRVESSRPDAGGERQAEGDRNQTLALSWYQYDRIRDSRLASGLEDSTRPTGAVRPHHLKRFLLPPGPAAEPGRIRLTFDDGPHPTVTPAVLDRLASYHHAAAFFLVGSRVAAAPDLPAAIRAAGHVVGNHTFTHRRLPWGDTAAARIELTRCQEVVPQATHFRPPFGRLTPGLWRAARRLGLTPAGWSLDAHDWRCRTLADTVACARRLLAAVRPGDVILLHDDRPTVLPLLDVLLPGLRERGLLGG
jgi:peptidoglycan/xylan/chitin deacetylase (PgdA/CDA1 family)